MPQDPLLASKDQSLPVDTRTSSLARIHELTTELLHVEDMSGFLTRIADSVRELFHFDRVSISIIDEERGIFTDHALAGYKPEDEIEIDGNPTAFLKEEIMEDFREDCKISSIAYYIPVEKQTSPPDDFVAVKDREAASKPRKAPGRWHELDLLYFALYDQAGELIGYLQVDYPEDGMVPSADTVAEIELFASIAAVGIENSKIYQSVHSMLQENKARTENTLRLLELTRSVLRARGDKEHFSLDQERPKVGAGARSAPIRARSNGPQEIYSAGRH
jgi:GAF domain-containing protein